MARKKKVEVPEEETPEEENPKGKGKFYDVLDARGDLINIYEDKKQAESLAGKVKGRKVVPSPAGRTREDVNEALRIKKAERLAQLEENQQVME